MQPSAKMYRVGILRAAAGSVEALRQSLRDLGYVEGQNVVLDIRDTEGRPERADDLALQLVRLRADVIVVTNPQAAFSAKRATTTIPIVMAHTPDPVRLGLVSSLARPGGNITGTTTLSVDLSIKQIELLKEAIPRAARIAVVANPESPWHPLVVKGLRGANVLPGVQLQIVEIRGADEFDAAFRTMVRERAQGVLVLADPVTFHHRARLTDLAVKHGLPLIGGPRAYTEAGGLMSYWADEIELGRRVASYVDRILKGARPGDLPIEQPTKYDFVVNLKTAKALALTIPSALLLRATVIE
jgi:putative ABC transport system substrate-binding protein